MAESKFLKYQDANGDRIIDECEMDIPGPADKLCLSCRPNPLALVSVWTEREDQTVELNEKKCLYEFNYQTNETDTISNPGGDSEGLMEQERDNIISAFFEAAVKKATPDAITLVNNSLKLEGFNLFARQISFVNLLVSVPFETYQELEDDEIDEDDDTEDGPIVVTFDADSFDMIMTRVRKGLHLYGRYQKLFQFQDKGFVFSSNGKPLNLAAYGDFMRIGRGEDAKLKQVFKYVVEFLKNRDYTFSPIAMMRDKVTKIRFVFTKKYKLKKIKVKTVRCKEKWIKLGGIKSLKRRRVFKDPTAMAYLANAKDMERSLTSRVPMPWVEFVKTYTYPEVIAKPELNIEGDEKTILSCVSENLVNEAKEFGQDVLDESFGLFEAIGHLFRDSVCFMSEEERLNALKRNCLVSEDATVEDLEKLKASDINVFGKKPKDACDSDRLSALIKLNQEDGFDENHYLFSNICSIVCSDASPTVFERNMLDGLFENLDRVKICGLLDLLLEAINCLLGGLSLEEALSKICASALRAMSLENLDVLFVGLPPEKQQEIALVVKKRLESGKSPGLILSGENIESADTVTEIRQSSLPTAPWSGVSESREVAGNVVNTAPEVDSYGNFSQGNDSSNPAEEGTLAEQYNAGPAGTPETALGLWIEAIIEVYSNDLLGLVDILNKFPGAQLIANIISIIDCPRPPVMDPNLLDFMNSLQIPFCKNQNPIVAPRLINPFYELMQLKDYWWILKYALYLAIQNLIDSLIKMLFCKICDILNSAVCTALALVGDLAEAAFSKDSLRNIMKDTICGDSASDQLAEEALAEMFAKYGANPEALADKERFNNFLSDLSSTMTSYEITSGILGDPSRDGLRTAVALVNNSYPEFADIFGTESDIAGFLESIGNVAPIEARRFLAENLDSLRDQERPSNPSLCATDEQIDQFCAVRASILEDRVTPEELEALCVQGRQPVDLEELTDILQKGIVPTLQANLPPIVSEPGCDDGILPYESEQQVNAAIAAVTNGIEQLKVDFTYDMIGNGPFQRNWGLINMVLSDTNGDPLTTHIRQTNSPFFRRRNVDFYYDIGEDDPEKFDLNYAKNRNQKSAFPLYVGEWLFDGRLKSIFDERLNDGVSYKNDTKERKLKGTGDWRQLGNFNYLDQTQFGFNDTYRINYEKNEYKIFAEARKKTPNIKLRFQDNSKGDGDGVDYSFAFDMNAFFHDKEEVDDTFVNTRFDTTRVVIKNVLSLMDLAGIEEDDKKTNPDKKTGKLRILDELTAPKYEFLTIDDTFKDINDHEELESILIDYSTSDKNKPPQIAFFESMSGRSIAASEIESLNKKAIKSLRDIVLDEENPGFNYGAKFQGLVYEQTEYVVNQGGTAIPYATYASSNDITNEDQILGISQMQFDEENKNGPKNRIFYLDPGLYGGSYLNPKIYVAPEINEGWLGLIDTMFPEVSPCKPYRVDLVDFDEIEQQVKNGYSSTPEDKRIFSDPDCVIEKPFDRILERVSKVGIATAIKSACKIYASVHIVKTLPVFAKIKPDFKNNFSDIYSQFIVEEMEESLKDAGGDFLSSFKESEFWYAFLEQSVQYYNDLEEAGKINNPPEHIIHTLRKLRQAQKDYDYPQREDLASEEAKATLGIARLAMLKEYRFRKNLEVVKTFEDDCKIVLKELVKQEVETMANIFIENAKRVKLIDRKNYIHHMGYFFLENICEGNDLDLQKEIELEIIDIENLTGSGLYTDGNQFSVESTGEKYTGYYHSHVDEAGDTVFMEGEEHSDEPHELLIPLADMTLLEIGDVPEYSTKGGGDFKVVKYLKVEGQKKNTTEIFNIISANAGNPDANISDEYPGSLRLVSSDSVLGGGLEPNAIGTATTGLTGELGLRYGLALCYKGTEVATAEVDLLDLPISQAQPLTSEGGQITPVGSKILFCLINKLVDDTRFKIMTEYIIPMKKHASLLAIYVDYAMLRSIGEVTTDHRTDEITEKPGMFLNPKKVDNSEDVEAWEQEKEDIQDKADNAKINDRGEFVFKGDAGYGESEGKLNVFQQIAYVNDNLRDRPPNFITTLEEGKGAPGWTTYGRRNGLSLFYLKWDEWDQETLIRSRRRLKRIFKQYYHNRDFKAGEYPDEARPGRAVLQNLKEKIKPAPGVRGIPWWRKRASNPLNADNQICKNRD